MTEYEIAWTKGYNDCHFELLKTIEDIKAEIQQVVEEEADDERWSRGLHYALKIIDKHIGKERMNEQTTNEST